MLLPCICWLRKLRIQPRLQFSFAPLPQRRLLLHLLGRSLVALGLRSARCPLFSKQRFAVARLDQRQRSIILGANALTCSLLEDCNRLYCAVLSRAKSAARRPAFFLEQPGAECVLRLLA